MEIGVGSSVSLPVSIAGELSSNGVACVEWKIHHYTAFGLDNASFIYSVAFVRINLIPNIELQS